MTSRQMKDLLRNMSKGTGVNAQILQRNYMLERLLERISLSEYQDNFILKGGMLIAAMVGIDSRSTIDLDASIKGMALEEKKIKKIFNNLVQMDIGDGIMMTINRIEEIREEFEYSCFRISIDAQVDNTKIPLKVDISTGDTITPSEVKYEFTLLLEERTIEVWAYNIETVLAEKMETLISRSVFNTRMRDYYDIYILTILRPNDININVLAEAVLKTNTNRGTTMDFETIDELLGTLFRNDGLIKLWRNYQRKFPYAEDIAWEELEVQVRKLYRQVREAIK